MNLLAYKNGRNEIGNAGLYPLKGRRLAVGLAWAAIMLSGNMGEAATITFDGGSGEQGWIRT